MNRLQNEHSPYLRQHQNNPVDWYPWGEEAFQKAKAENKPIFLSIGYSTCYWCHVMEKDSFEQNDVAEVLNRFFVSIKVDREERPDVDSIYMSAVIQVTGQGGWPMSVFLTPDRKPFYGGTFFPKDRFIPLLTQLERAWREQPEALQQSAAEIGRLIAAESKSEAGSEPSPTIFPAFVKRLQSSFDDIYGGFSPAPKFPPSQSLRALLRISKRNNDDGALKLAEVTLDRMARGGLFDHLGGGFHRYSTDRRWLVPHFEKMLYDNAQLAMTYFEAYQLTKNDLYLCVARETLDYLQTGMTADHGGYFSAEDAGEVGKEGEFYVWSETELREHLDEKELQELKRIYGVTSLGNFEDGLNILNLQDKISWTEKSQGFTRTALEKLRNERSKREAPHRDEKTLASWNGLAISAMSKGYQVTGDIAYAHSAENAARFLRSKMFINGELLHRYFEGESGVPGMLDDYAFLIQGLLDLYEARGHSEWYIWAVELEKKARELFWDEEANLFYTTSTADSSLIVRKFELPDGAEPSGNGVMAGNLIRLLHYSFESAREKTLKSMLSSLAGAWERYPTAFSSSLIAFDLSLGPVKEVVIAGERDHPEARKLAQLLAERFLPNVLVAWSGKDGENVPPLARGKIADNEKGVRFYVCEMGTCKLPVDEAAAVMGML